MAAKVSEPKRKPIHVARVGNVRVPVYKFLDGRFCVAWRQFAGGKRIRETAFDTQKAAIARAQEIALALANSQADVVTLTSADRDVYRLAVQKLAKFGAPLHVAIDEWAAARERLGAHSISEAVNSFMRGHVDRMACPPSEEIATELKDQLRDPHRPASVKHLEGISQHLPPFCKSFPKLDTVTEKDLRAYLRELKTRKGGPVSARTRDNVLGSILRLFRFARTRGYFPADRITPAEQIGRVSIQGEVRTYSPEVLGKLFAAVEKEWLPWLALAAFAGLRTSEIFRLRWDAIRWSQGVIAVPIRVARKVNRPRLVPVLPNLQLWLADKKEAVGPIYFPEPTWEALEKRHGRAIKALEKAVEGFKWDRNALRHSFGSYRLAKIQNIEQLRLEMGNSPRQIQTYYNDPKTAEEAALYFSIVPGGAVKNVVQMHKAGK